MPNVESVIRKLNCYNFDDLLSRFTRLADNFGIA